MFKIQKKSQDLSQSVVSHQSDFSAPVRDNEESIRSLIATLLVKLPFERGLQAQSFHDLSKPTLDESSASSHSTLIRLHLLPTKINTSQFYHESICCCCHSH